MIGTIIITVVYFLLFAYIFIFKLIKKNDTAYLSILLLQSIGILLQFIHIIFNIFSGIAFKIIINAFCIVIPILIFAIEEKGINFSELVYLGLAKLFLFFKNTKKAKDALIQLIIKYDKSYSGHKLLAEIYEKEGGMRKSIDEYIKVLDIKGDDYQSYFKISKLLNDLNKKDESIQMLKNLVKKKPEMYEANKMLRRFANGKRKL